MSNATVILALSALRQPRFGELVTSWRASTTKPISVLAAEAGIAPATWCDAEAGRDVRLSTAVRLIEWAMRCRLI